MMITAAQYLPTLPQNQQTIVRRSVASPHSRAEKTWKENAKNAPKTSLPPLIKNRVTICGPKTKPVAPANPPKKKTPVYFGYAADKAEGLCPFAKTVITISCNMKMILSCDEVMYDILGRFQYTRHIAKDHGNRACPEDQLCTNTTNYIAQEILESLRTWIGDGQSQTFDHPADEDCESLNSLFEVVAYSSNIFSFKYVIKLQRSFS